MVNEIQIDAYLREEAEQDPLDPPVIGGQWKCSIGLFLYRNGNFKLDDYIDWLIRTRKRAVCQEAKNDLCKSG
jgi:hypothetical protein